jgi:hypothetical protein
VSPKPIESSCSAPSGLLSRGKAQNSNVPKRRGQGRTGRSQNITVSWRRGELRNCSLLCRESIVMSSTVLAEVGVP